MTDLHAELNDIVLAFKARIEELEKEHGVEIEVWRSYLCSSTASLKTEVKKKYSVAIEAAPLDTEAEAA